MKRNKTYSVKYKKKVLNSATRKEAMQYTGERKLVGIAMMHKKGTSCLQMTMTKSL